MTYALDLTHYHFVKQRGDITIYGTWVGEDVADSEPCLALVPTHSRGRVTPCCVALSSAWKYDEPSYMLSMAMHFNRALGFADSMSSVHRVATAIHDHLQDLIEMPPRPVRSERAAADAVITEESGRRHEATLYEQE